MVPTDANEYRVAYKQEDDEDFEVKVNREMLERAIGALDHLAPMLKFVVFPTGTRVSSIGPRSERC